MKRRHEPRQSRSRELVRAIVEATGRLLSADDSLSTNRIAELAGVSIGSLYRYFPSKESIVAAVAHRRLRDTFEPLLDEIDASRGRTLEAAVAGLVDGIIRMKASHAAVDHGVIGATLRHGLTDEALSLDDDYVRRFAAAIEAWKPRVRADLPSDLAAFVLFQSIRATMILGARRPAFLDDPRLATELAHLILGYLVPREKR